jgi:hypothetical protein
MIATRDESRADFGLHTLCPTWVSYHLSYGVLKELQQLEITALKSI